MQLSRRKGPVAAAILAVIAVALSVLGVPAGPAADGMRPIAARQSGGPGTTDQRPTDVLPAGGRWTVTLLTGDVVDVAADAEGRVSARMRDPRSWVTTMGLPTGELYVFPHSVQLLLDDVVDRELFDVVGLIRQGYDDASSDSIRLIVQRQPDADLDLQATLGSAGDETPLPSIDAVALSVPKSATAQVPVDAADASAPTEQSSPAGPEEIRARFGGLAKVWLDGRVSAPPVPEEAGGGADAAVDPGELDRNITQIGADRAWAAGFEGEGIRVGVLDTGVDPDHPDIAGQVVALEEFVFWEDSPIDLHGHGTHVASTIAGTGAAANGARRGVAPAADLVIGKVLSNEGWGVESGIIEGMEWAAPQSDVVSMSLGGGLGDDGSDPLSLAVDRLSDQYGTLFVVAAGNDGPVSGTIGSPGTSDRALTVGAVDGEDQVTEWSSRGPLFGSHELKPEVVAPGWRIVAARAERTSMGTPVGQQYTAASGTSMATPHVAGAAALLAEAHPDWSPGQLKNLLVGSADGIDGEAFATGSGRIDIGDAITATVRSERDVVDVALPHPRPDEHVETLTWTNSGDQPVTLSLAAELEDRNGGPVDAVAVEPAAVTLAPGGTGHATLRIDAAALGSGRHSGTVVASAPDGSTVRTPLAVHASVEMTDLTLRSTPTAEMAGLGWLTVAAVVNLDDYTEFAWQGVLTGESQTLRVPVGRYAVVGEISHYAYENRMVAQVGDGDVQIDGDVTVELDGSAAIPFDPTVEGVDTGPAFYGESMAVVTPATGAGGFGFGFTTWPGGYPYPPIWVSPLAGDPDLFGAHLMFRLQAEPFTAEVGGDALEISTVPDQRTPALGSTTVTAFDLGNGADMTPAKGGLAVVIGRLGNEERAAATQRAFDAGVAVLAFVDDQAPRLAWPGAYPRFADIPVITLGGPSASRLLAAGRRHETVTVRAVASPFVYDIVRSEAGRVDPAPVITAADRAKLARLDESFHRDPDGPGPTVDERRPVSVSAIDGQLALVGALPEHRTAYVTPGVTWATQVNAWHLIRLWGDVYPVNSVVSADGGRVYGEGSRQSVSWLTRPMVPGPVNSESLDWICRPERTTRTPDTLYVNLATHQEARDYYGSCITDSPPESLLTLSRDGVEIGRHDGAPALLEFPIPADAATYRLTYDQAGQQPYVDRTSTAWTFRMAEANGEEVVPLLVVDYELPLDTLNRPTGRTAVLSISRATGAPRRLVLPPKVWTSTDDGATWRRAPVRWSWFGTFRVTLPQVAPGTGVSLEVDASDIGGSRVEQTLIDAYVG